MGLGVADDDIPVPAAGSERLRKSCRGSRAGPRAQADAEGKLELERLTTYAEIPDCTLLGGHGWDEATFVPGTPCTLRFTEEGIWVHPPDRWRALIRSPYSAATELELSGPGGTPSAGKVLGATLVFGVIGTAYALAHPDIESFIRYKAGDSLEAVFSCKTWTPEELRVQLSKVLSFIGPPARNTGGTDTVSELERLAELHKSGALSDEEFATLKSKIIARL